MNPNSALIWLPAIEAAGLPVPKTVIIPYSHGDTLSIFDGAYSKEFTRLCVEVRKSVHEVGLPAFIRTDLSSAKHSGPKAYRIDAGFDISGRVGATIEDSEMKFMFEYANAIMVRQFLTLPAPFTAFGGLPISREFRIFADGERVICGPHPYWPVGAVEDHVGDVPDWQLKLRQMHMISPVEISELNAMAVRAAAACDGKEWSVDFAQDDAGKWWLLDMATGKDSYHWPGCPRSQENP